MLRQISTFPLLLQKLVFYYSIQFWLKIVFGSLGKKKKGGLLMVGENI